MNNLSKGCEEPHMYPKYVVDGVPFWLTGESDYPTNRIDRCGCIIDENEVFKKPNKPKPVFDNWYEEALYYGPN